MIRVVLILTSLMFLACNKKEIFDGPNSYSDGFESYNTIEETINGDDQNWSFLHNTLEENRISIDTSVVYSGSNSIKFVGGKTEDDLSKASINKQNMAFWEDDIVSINFWLYLVDSESAQWLFICDLEEQAIIGAGPGMRLAIVDDQILLEHKIPNPNVKQEGDGIDFPRDQWVNIQFETKLSQKKEGYVKVYQDNVLIIDQDNWTTLPSDLLYGTQGTQGGYSKIEFGITANPEGNDQTMYVDEVSVEVIN